MFLYMNQNPYIKSYSNQNPIIVATKISEHLRINTKYVNAILGNL